MVVRAAQHALHCALPVRILYVSHTVLDSVKQQELLARIHSLVDELLAGVNLAGIDIETGVAEDIIVETGVRYDVDVIMLGRRNRSTVERIYVGSTTSAVISLATQPVLVVAVDS